VGGRLIFLHGPSSSGKSTLAGALQARIEAPFWHYSIDHLRDSGVLPMARFRRGDFAWSEARTAFFDGFHRSVASFLEAGNDLILEHILDTAGWHGQLAGLLAGTDVFFVGLRCSLDELNRREAARGDRPAGSAAADHELVHRGLRYDLELDTEIGPDINAERLLAAWRQRQGPSAFFAASPVRQPA
jgi:chloramphenicol 3-O phosphotransferase